MSNATQTPTGDEFGPDTQHAEGWIPTNPGDSVVGTVIDVDAGWSDLQQRSYPIVVVEQDDHSQKGVHCLTAILRSRVMLLKPQAGERIKFVHHGRKDRTDGTSVTLSTVQVAGRSATDVYQRLAGDVQSAATDPAEAGPDASEAPF
jgi:hypothetical protein